MRQLPPAASSREQSCLARSRVDSATRIRYQGADPRPAMRLLMIMGARTPSTAWNRFCSPCNPLAPEFRPIANQLKSPRGPDCPLLDSDCNARLNWHAVHPLVARNLFRRVHRVFGRTASPFVDRSPGNGANISARFIGQISAPASQSEHAEVRRYRLQQPSRDCQAARATRAAPALIDSGPVGAQRDPPGRDGPAIATDSLEWIDDNPDNVRPSVVIDGETFSVMWGTTIPNETKGARPKATTYVFASAHRDAVSILAPG